MATVKIKFRPSTISGEQGTIFYQVIHNRVTRQQKTGYRLYAYEWNSYLSEVILPTNDDSRRLYLSEISENIRMDFNQLQHIITHFERNRCNYTTEEIISEFRINTNKYHLFPFMEDVISNLRMLGKVRTSETYTTTLNSFKRFRQHKDLTLEDINSDLMMAYEAFLRKNGVRPNSSSFYMRNLRAVYNRAVEKELTTQRFPFKHVYTGIDKTVKRAVPLKVIKQIKELDFTLNPQFDFARNMFLFSFYTRGMSFIDMAYLRKTDLQNGILTYRRRKTGQELNIKWEKCMAEIIAKNPANNTAFLLPIIKEEGNERRQYDNALHLVNYHLKDLSERLKLQRPLTMYVARHSWASAAKAKNIPLSVISEGMGHDSEATTQIYLASLETSVVDKANKMILGLL